MTPALPPLDIDRWNAVMARITGPTLILDEPRCRRNIARMAEVARRGDAVFRPHFKTHQSRTIGRWFREVGVTAITVSSLEMAEYFATDGWDDITVAFPVNPREIDRINALAVGIRLGLLVENPDSAAFLVARVESPVDVWIEIDCGHGRSGVRWNAPGAAAALARTLNDAPNLRLRGLLTHAGHTYAARSPQAIQATHDTSLARLVELRGHLAEQGFDALALSYGDTPSCSVVADLSALDELRPGNFVYYDMQQVMIGACTLDDLALAVACPVVGLNPVRGQIVVHGGAVHLSKDSYQDAQGRLSYGAVVLWTGAGWLPVVEAAYVASLSQEHGVIHADAETLARVRVGDLAFILPAHACLTADLHRYGVTLTGEAFAIKH